MTTGGYSSSKAASAHLFQSLADEVPASTMQIINLHPGLIYSAASQDSGYSKDAIPWDSGTISRSTMPDTILIHLQ